ncbi:aminoglycoside phosphotransferase family protein [Bacillus sp. AFS017336]|uniref:aminoglycoside phosphotransferase family protein n=1 Tax=Bacillus sp. AFS017336 TaxID=2033489 RepID=UPI000BF20C3D|nr:aminoglycoside phosphotransferase family protein [Bacillus sp. AFS017336]PEL14465.1 aminoglycoside phosphotransferase APH(3') [Bacillus sp. AFS017336]
MEPIRLKEIPNGIRSIVGDIIEIAFPRQGHTSNVGILKTTNGYYVLKRTKGEQYSSLLTKEVHVLNELSQTELSIPKVYNYIEDKNEDSFWSLMENIEGETLRSYLSIENTKEKKYEAIYNFGKTLSKLHSTICPDSLINNKLWLDDQLIQADYNIKNFKVDGTLKVLNRLKENKPRTVNQTLIHGDFTIDNVLVKNGEITGIIDWSGGAYGDPRYDVSLAIRPKPNIFENKAEVTIFFEGYGNRLISDEEYQYFVGIYEFF